jgi:RNA polymerase sigma factor (sigma-70 family)
LLRFLSRHTSNDNAEDCIQHSFERLAILDATGRARIVSPMAYLRRAVGNVLRDQHRQAARRETLSFASDEAADLHGPDPIAALETRDMLKRLEAAMLRLKPLTREVFLAHRIDGYTYSEIAQRTGLSARQVERHISKAIAHIDRTFGRH